MHHCPSGCQGPHEETTSNWEVGKERRTSIRLVIIVFSAVCIVQWHRYVTKMPVISCLRRKLSFRGGDREWFSFTFPSLFIQCLGYVCSSQLCIAVYVFVYVFAYTCMRNDCVIQVHFTLWMSWVVGLLNTVKNVCRRSQSLFNFIGIVCAMKQTRTFSE